MPGMDLFGELRSTLQDTEARRIHAWQWGASLLELSRQVHQDDPGTWSQLWAPYLQEHLEPLHRTILSVRSLEALEEAVTLLPGARLRLSGSRNTDTLGDILASPHLPSLGALSLQRYDLTEQDCIALAQTPTSQTRAS